MGQASSAVSSSSVISPVSGTGRTELTPRLNQPVPAGFLEQPGSDEEPHPSGASTEKPAAPPDLLAAAVHTAVRRS